MYSPMSAGRRMSTCEAGRKTGTPMSTSRPPLILRQQHFVLADADHAAFQNPLDINMPNGFTQLTFECGVGVAAIKFGGQCGFDVCIRDVNVADQRAIYHVFVLFPSDDPPANAPWT
jgi:hypothetical protein